MGMVRVVNPHGGRLAAASAGLAIGLHVWIALTQSHSAWMAAVMLAMAALCAPCAIGAWRACTTATMTTLMGMSLASALVNVVVILIANATPHSGHGVSQQIPLAVTAGSEHSLLMLGVIAVELVAGCAAAVRVRQFRLNA